ncbi:MAG: type II toxin-antitoxin system RelE/ParE family toxin [Alphaproteobacteria bacterium]|nr:type II toxin-antitoxin system RelE/ParE family toxin [Alphaproteobacteria bacterium]
MFCVIQTDDFVSAAKAAGLSDTEVQDIVNAVSADPELGEKIKGTGGARKWRVNHKQKGKRSGARVVSFYSGEDIPVFLLDVYAKGERIDLSQRERNDLKIVLGGIAADYRANVSRKVAQLKETGT